MFPFSLSTNENHKSVYFPIRLSSGTNHRQWARASRIHNVSLFLNETRLFFGFFLLAIFVICFFRFDVYSFVALSFSKTKWSFNIHLCKHTSKKPKRIATKRAWQKNRLNIHAFTFHWPNSRAQNTHSKRQIYWKYSTMHVYL